MRKMIALVLCLCLLLCGCGGTTAASSAAVSSADDSAAPVSTTDVSVAAPEESATEEETKSPSELAKELWAMAEAAQENLTAVDYDLSIYNETEVDGVCSTSQASVRTATIYGESPMVYTKTTTEDVTTEVWYGNDTLYQANSLGNYQVPMTYEEYASSSGTSADEDAAVLDLDLENFGQYSALSQGNYYTIVFSQPTLDTWMSFTGLLGLDENTISCTAFDMSGTMQCDLEGNVTKLSLDMTFALDIDGTIASVSTTVNQLTMGINDQVSIELPTEGFVSFPDASIPTALSTCQLVTSLQPSLQYQNIWCLMFTSDYENIVVTQNDMITYVTDENGLQSQWDSSTDLDGEILYSSSDVYAGGSGVITDTDGEWPYEYDDETTLSDSLGFIFYNTGSLGYGSNFSIADNTLTYDLSEEYIEYTLLDSLGAYDLAYFMTDGTVESLSGNMLYVIDDSGLLLSQLMTMTAELTYEGETISITLMDGGDVLAIGSDVVMP